MPRISARPVLATLAAMLVVACLGAAAQASSIVYVKDNAVWVTSPDGKHQVKLASGRKFASPSQADDGTIVALGDDNHLYRFSHSGRPIGKPVATWLGLGGGSGFSGPYRTRVSPDGKKVAFTVLHVQGLDQVSGNSEVEGITSYSYVDRYTPPGVLGLVKGWDNPAWIDSSHTVAFNPGADAFPDGVNVAYHELGHANPNAVDDMHHAYTWFDDPSASYMVFGDITRKGDKLAVGEDGFAATRTIRLYSVATRPPYKDDAPVYRCRLANPPGDGYESVSWSPDGQSLAYQAGGSIYTVHVGEIAGGCAGLGKPRLLVAGGTSPSWGPAGVG
jgi:WD40 repeat protein